MVPQSLRGSPLIHLLTSQALTHPLPLLQEAETARAELVALQSVLPDAPPTPTNHRVPLAPPSPPSETCSICFNEAVVVKQVD